MPDRSLQLVIRTPRAVVFDAAVASIRVPTETGQVGLRPRSEATVFAVEPGLILVRDARFLRYAGTAGGLLRCDGASVVILTPLAVVGDELDTVLKQLDETLAVPNTEQEVRTMLRRLEQNILQELEFGRGTHLKPEEPLR
jgi:F0F1-type ATP synthase epsilon subunit